MALSRWKSYPLLIFLALIAHATVSAAANFSQCLIDIASCANNSASPSCTYKNISSTIALSLLRTSKGAHVETIDKATALSYAGCLEHCGETQEAFSWTVFSQQYAQWLLPYLALLSQLPFGSRHRMDNLNSVILALGSPILAGYSLYLTLLNARWVNEQLFSGIEYPNVEVRNSVVRVLCSLQQVPLRVHPGQSARFESLVVHPDNDEWWITLAEGLDYSHTWSIASATSIVWVVIAYLLTVADSLSNVADNINTSGQGTGSVWLWLLAIVVGWLVLSPKCDYSRVHEAYHKANKQAFVADRHEPTADATRVHSDFGLTISPSPEWDESDRNITSPDESRIPPIFNYSRSLSWCRTAYLTSLFYRAAWKKSSRRVSVDSGTIPGNVRNDVPRECRLGNRDQIIHYCLPDQHEYRSDDVLWPRGMTFNMIVASLMALFLQWGTTGAALLAAWFTPTIGFGCRSLTYLIYGMLSTSVWVFLLSSSILGYYAHYLGKKIYTPDLENEEQRAPKPRASNASEPLGFPDGVYISLHEIRDTSVDEEEEMPPGVPSEPASITMEYSRLSQTHVLAMARLADWLRWTGKYIAIVNAIGIVATSIFQFASVYDNCFCNSSVYFWGSSYAFDIISPDASDISLAKSAWIGALVLGLTSCAGFLGTMYLVGDSLPS